LQLYFVGSMLTIRTAVISCILSSCLLSWLPHRKCDRNLSDLSLDYFREPHNLLFRTFAASGFMFPMSTSDGKKGTSKFIEKVVGYPVFLKSRNSLLENMNSFSSGTSESVMV